MKRLPRASSPPATVAFELDGEPMSGLDGEPVACALLAAGEKVFSRSIKYHRPRGPYCFASACTQCLMRVDGVPNVYTCRTPLRPGMRVERQNAYPSVKHDVFAAIDWMFPNGLDHHEMFAGVPVAEDVMARVARKLAGLGELPDRAMPPPPPPELLRTRVAVVGGGAAGLAAARVLAREGVPFLLLERDDVTGGVLASGPDTTERPASAAGEPNGVSPGAPAPPGLVSAAAATELLPRDQVRLRTQALGFFEDAEGRFLLAVHAVPGEQRALKLYADRFLFAPGGHPALWPFENNDVPGVFAGRAVSRLLRRHHLLPGSRAALVGTGDELQATARLVEAHGITVSAAVEVRASSLPPGAHPATVLGEAERALGRGSVSGLSFRTRPGGERRKVECDFLAVCLPPSPSFELPRQAGAQVRFHPDAGHFVVEADADGRTAAPDVFVAGEVLGPRRPDQAAQSGERAARALLASLEGRP